MATEWKRGTTGESVEVQRHVLLFESTKNLFDRVKSIYEETGYGNSYALNAFWAHQNMQDMHAILSASADALAAIHAAQATWMFSVNTAEPIKEKAVDWHLAQLARAGNDLFNMPPFVQESHFSNPGNNVLRSRRNLTPDFCRILNIALEINKYCLSSKSKFKILELGGGLGHLARLLKLFHPNASYVIIDIPETLCFSHMFLKLNFPDASALYVTDPDQLTGDVVDRFDFLFVPTLFAESLLDNKFDLFLNTASLGEMKNSVIRYWMDFIQNKLTVKYLFGLNRYLNTIIPGLHDWRLDENECSVLYDANWKIVKWEVEPPFTRCPYVDTIAARYLEIVAERSVSVSTDEKEARSQKLLLDVMDEDWVRLESAFPAEMSYRDNVLVNDMTMNGTLFKLWDSIRLNANESNVILMLKYLETLMHQQDREFEETFYYKQLLDSLVMNSKRNDVLEMSKTVKAKRQSSSAPRLVEEDYRGYNIVLWGLKYYGLSMALGPLDLELTDDGILNEYVEVGACVVGSSADEVKELVDQLL
jgi:putative sugar O-methyltransferase